ncbi:FliM/FliN family flagellar motor C-terminal domain-containing protein [Sphingomonas silueang]|uniref:FliM/FliN family flagellar motor C-terminal domain-containing protein n=1 Tax=Sphingomonas silueang TaxID=3156617 RepID=UPI0032B4604F
MTQSPTAPARIDPRLIDTVPLELEAVLGRATMTVGELAALKADGIVPLDAPLNRQVELRLNGVAVARGELVAVEDRFAVRIGEIAAWPA